MNKDLLHDNEIDINDLMEIINDDDVIIIGSVIGDGEELLISRESGEIFSFFDGETETYDDFDDLLTCLSGFMEDSAEKYLGADWGDIYDERFECE